MVTGDVLLHLPELPLIECFEYALDRTNGVEQISVQGSAIFASYHRRLRVDETFLLQLPHILCHRNYISESACGIKQYLSPLYRARICVEELPESCRFMKSLRVKLRSDPDFGKAISQVGSYLKFRQS